MESRLFSNASDSPQFCDPVYAREIRNRIAALPTSKDRVLAIKELGVAAQNFICNLIITDLLADRSVIANYATYSTLNSISIALHKESYTHLDLKRGWTYMLGHKTLCHDAAALNDPDKLLQLDNIAVTDANQKLWRELSDWFAGKYYKFAFKDGCLREFQKGILGNYPLLDSNDRLLWLFTGVRQLDLSTPYYMMSRKINRRLPAKAASKQCSPQMFHSSPPNRLPQPSAPPLIDAEGSQQRHLATVIPTAPAWIDDESTEEHVREEFECPLTLVRMQNAVICTLDGITYEASVLQASLASLGRTPTNIPVAREDIPNIFYPNTSLQNAINCYNKGESEEECYRCEITKRTMQSAVFCKLDQHSYDEAAIREYLLKHQKTPSGITLQDGIQIDDVLVPNLALRNAIESHNQLEQTNTRRNSFSTYRQ